DFAIYSNPNNGDFQVQFNTAVPDGAVLELYDLLGRKLAEYPLSGSGNIANINGIEVASAIYYATVVVPSSFRKSVKMVIMR
ncbi:MAG: T9SS type A sorting domain-containing protein, partial [Bacteroidales bacterium]|nr:T9SS type A sorting domain-containing protein [Bacteroidales bacterium]